MTSKNHSNMFNRIKSYILDIEPRKIYQLIEYGIPKREGTISQLRENGFSDLKGPIFFLSTGRCGTQWFARHLARDRKLKVFHESWPNFAEASIQAYKYCKTASNHVAEIQIDLFQEIFLSGREDQIRFSFKTNRCFVETNHYLTFFAAAR